MKWVRRRASCSRRRTLPTRMSLATLEPTFCRWYSLRGRAAVTGTNCVGTTVGLFPLRPPVSCTRSARIAPAPDIDGAVYELLGTINQPAIEATGGVPPAWLKQIRDYLDDNFAQPCSVGDLASAADVHPVYLTRLFRRFYRHSVMGYVRRLRVRAGRGQTVVYGYAPVSGCMRIGVRGPEPSESHFQRRHRRAPRPISIHHDQQPGLIHSIQADSSPVSSPQTTQRGAPQEKENELVIKPRDLFRLHSCHPRYHERGERTRHRRQARRGAGPLCRTGRRLCGPSDL